MTCNTFSLVTYSWRLTNDNGLFILVGQNHSHAAGHYLAQGISFEISVHYFCVGAYILQATIYYSLAM